MTPDKPTVGTHVLVKKLQEADWSTEKAGSEAHLKICVGAFNPSTKEQRTKTAKEVHNVEIDGVLDQPNTHRSAIGKTLCINYRINNTLDAFKILALILS